MALLRDGNAVTFRELLARSAIDKARLSRTTRKLCAQGYVEQRPVEGDRRQVILHLTPRGKEVCRDLMVAMLDLQTRLVGRVGSEEYKVFERVLRRFAEPSAPKGAE